MTQKKLKNLFWNNSMFDMIYNDNKNRHKTIIILTFFSAFLICIVLSYCFIWHIPHKEINEFIKSFTSSVITFMSICFGFYLTSLSILFSSQYIKTLNVEDAQKPTQRKIHTIREYFKLAIYCSLLTIVLALMVLSMSFVLQNKYILITSFSIFIAVFIENFVFIYLLLKIFMNALIIQAIPK